MSIIKLQYACFKIGEETYAADIMTIREIIRSQRVTRVPKAPDFMEGVINLRGTAVPIIDMRRRLGLLPKDNDTKSRIVIVKIAGKDAGLLVDRVERVVNVGQEEVKDAPSIVKGVESEYLKGVIWDKDELIMILDLEKILSAAEKINFGNIERLNNTEVSAT